MSTNDANSESASTEGFDASSVGPTIDLADVELPPDVGERFQTLYGTEEPPRDAEAWIDATREGVEAVRNRAPTVEDLCTASDGAHAFEGRDGDHSQRYICVLDPIAYAFIEDEPGTVEATTPVREETVEIDVTRDGVEVSHPEAVISIGVSDHVEVVDEVPPEVIYRQVCGYIHAFADEDEYERWASEVEAASAAVPVTVGVGLAAALAESLFR